MDEVGATLNTALVVMGDRLGLYRALAGAGPLSPSELADRTGTVLHCAASISFDLPLDEARRVNVEGTRQVIALAREARENGSLAGWETGTRVSGEDLLELECDILVLAAREDQIHGDNASRLRCRMIAEGANGPTSLEADAVLRERGIPIRPC